MPGDLVRGTETLTGVLIATMRDPSGSGPSVRLTHGFHFQEGVDITGIPQGAKVPRWMPIVTGRAHAYQPWTPATTKRNQTAGFTPGVINFGCPDLHKFR